MDVAVVGLGPVGGVLGVLLAAAGLDVAVVDPSPSVFPVPRAVALDDEVLRFLASMPGLPPLALVGRPRAEFVTASGQLLAGINFNGARNGHPGLAFFHQPSLETALRAALGDRVLVDALESLTPGTDSVRLGLASGRSLDARYVVGCDGAASTVRRLVGADFPGRTLALPWLVVDAVGAPIADTFRYICAPERPAVSMPVPGGHRWEWMCVGPTYSPEIPPGLSVTRSVEYTFAARTASVWRHGRVLLAGDAAHVMPPFAGQGLGAGLRDVGALWWRLVAAVNGYDRLDDYEQERRPHVRAMTRTALLAGSVVQTRSTLGAAAVRAALRGAAHSSWFSGGGLRPRTAGLLPNSLLDIDGALRRIDDLMPFGEWVDLHLLRSGSVEVAGAVGKDQDGALVSALRSRGGSLRVRPDRIVV